MLMSITDTLIKEQFEKDRKAKTMNTAKRMIWVTFRKEGIHKYPAALDDPKLATGDWDDVSFLRQQFPLHTMIEIQSLYNLNVGQRGYMMTKRQNLIINHVR